MTTATAESPIYDTLVQEQGDVLATARETAEEIKQQAEDVLHFGGPTGPGQAPAPSEDRPS
ncbi:hypothetical protein DY218_11630 [Streptomyces triticagri]|uniref:Uncharacterized protein n=1 Tax=Streptomyces triticagri TaxID=2293568 RepID=A0A372M6S6_9ACTN|nr:hypothetical protein [Streptomyces triticagri]RFU86561.1 hypothetical protein DY218_11630 [Streptomyces triticagri]